MPGQDSSVGVPSALNILLIKSISFSTRNSGDPRYNSAKMQPQDHISIGIEYSFIPRAISGAL